MLIEDGAPDFQLRRLYIPGMAPLFAVDVSVFELRVGRTRTRLLLRDLGSAVLDRTFCTMGERFGLFVVVWACRYNGLVIILAQLCWRFSTMALSFLCSKSTLFDC